jgi:hypothetical protein
MCQISITASYSMKTSVWLFISKTLHCIQICKAVNYGGLIPSSGREGTFSLHHHIQTSSGANTGTYPLGTGGSFPGIKQPWHEADHSPPSNAKVKNVWRYTSTPPRLHGMVLSSVQNTSSGHDTYSSTRTLSFSYPNTIFTPHCTY